MDNQIVSIILPFYNAELYLANAICSVMKQSISDWELILIDDGSTDSGYTIASSFDDPRIRVFKQINKGVSAARNFGIAQAQGSFMTFMDADDLLPERSLEVRRNLLKGGDNADIVGGSILVFSGDSPFVGQSKVIPGGFTGLYWPKLINIDQRVFFSIFIMFKSDLARNIKFNEGLSHCEDLLFLLKLAANKNLKYSSTTEITYFYRTGHTSAMSNVRGLISGYLRLLDSVSIFPNIGFHDFFLLYKRICLVLLKIILKRLWIIEGLSVTTRLFLIMFRRVIL